MSLIEKKDRKMGRRGWGGVRLDVGAPLVEDERPGDLPFLLHLLSRLDQEETRSLNGLDTATKQARLLKETMLGEEGHDEEILHFEEGNLES